MCQRILHYSTDLHLIQGSVSNSEAMELRRPSKRVPNYTVVADKVQDDAVRWRYADTRSESGSFRKRRKLAMENQLVVEPEPAATSLAKPLKVSNIGRNRRVGIVASKLQELRTKIQDHLSITGDDFEVVLDEDCTKIEDEEYFQTLPDNTVLIAVCEGERWTKASTSLVEDAQSLVEVDGAGTSDSNHLARVAEKIAKNPAIMAFLPKMDLEVVTDSDINQLQVLLCQSKDDAQFIQNACEKRLNELIRSQEATDLLKLYDRAKKETKNDSV